MFPGKNLVDGQQLSQLEKRQKTERLYGCVNANAETQGKLVLAIYALAIQKVADAYQKKGCQSLITSTVAKKIASIKFGRV